VVKAVNGVSFHVDKGETLGIVGESGCGKSVSVLSVMRLIPQPPGKIVGGKVMFDGRNLLDLGDDEIRQVRGNQIAMIFQDPMTSLNPVLTIGRQIGEALELHLDMKRDEARKRSAELLEMVGIPQAEDRLDDYPHQFSGGMRQRAMIAMGLACNPQLLIADEPTTALDVSIEAQILDIMRELQDTVDMAIMFITHNLGVVAEMAQDMVVMYMGKVVEKASALEMFYEAKHPYTRALLKSIPHVGKRSGERLASIKGMVPDPFNLPSGCVFHPRCPDFMPGKCDRIVPSWTQVEGEDHWARCLLYEEV
jgi:oligopeptide/dipeptide ABC transporter ATP-binding protein